MTPNPSLTVKNRQDAPAGAPTIWDLAVPLLTSTGTTEANARSYLGSLIKRYGELATLAVIADAVNKRPADARAWISKKLLISATRQVASDIYTPAKNADGAA